MRRLIDLTGQRFGRLTAVAIHPERTRSRGARWICQCECGKTTIVPAGDLKSGRVKSCGCSHTTHCGKHTKLYSVWGSMIQRCTNPKNKSYPNYGGRGISVCEEWRKDYSTFRTWALANGYSEGKEIDRIDNDGSYNPENCRWVSRAVNVTNTRVRKDSTTGVTGVYKLTNSESYLVKIGVNGKQITIGRFSSFDEAVLARQAAEKQYRNW